MGKLFETIAVEPSLDAAYKNAVQEAIKTFSKNPHLFEGNLKTLTMFSDEDAAQNGVTSRKERESTVKEKIDYVVDYVVKFYDCQLQKEKGNSQARGTVSVENDNGDKIEIMEDIPATFLLGMEKRLVMVRALIESIPTLEKGIKWVESSQEGEGVFETAHASETFKSAKTKRFESVAKATKEHQEQVVVYDDTHNVGKFSETRTSGAITTSDKSKYLGRLDRLLIGIKEARVRANTVETKNDKVALDMMNYIFCK